MIRNSDPNATIRTAKKAFDLFRQVQKNATPEQRAAWNKSTYENRWKNLAWMIVFSIITCSGLYLEIIYRTKFFDPVAWIVAIAITGLLSLVGVASVFGYIWKIINPISK